MSKSFCKLLANSLAMLTKHDIRINYIEEVIIKSHAKKIKYYQIQKKIL